MGSRLLAWEKLQQIKDAVHSSIPITGRDLFPLPLQEKWGSWCHAGVHALNVMTVGSPESPMGAGSPGQRKLLSEFVSVFSRNEDLLNSKSVNAYGEEIHHCRSVGWANLRSSLPTAEQAGVLSPEMVATGGVLDFLEHPTKYLLPLDERVSMKTPRVMIKGDDWDEVSLGLVRRGICEVIAVEYVFHVHGSPCLGGLFGVPKHETTPDGHEVLRLIMDLRPINRNFLAVEGDLGTLPMVTSLGGLEVRPHEDLLISSEDIRAMFYIVGLGPQWCPFLAFGKEVPDQLPSPRAYQSCAANGVHQ